VRPRFQLYIERNPATAILPFRRTGPCGQRPWAAVAPIQGQELDGLTGTPGTDSSRYTARFSAQ